MYYVGIPTEEPGMFNFKTSPRAHQAIWIILILWCGQQENDGVIKDCRKWTDHEWISFTAIEKREVMEKSKLWKWDGDDLIVERFPVKYQRGLIKSRDGGLKSAEMRAQRNGTHKPE